MEAKWSIMNPIPLPSTMLYYIFSKYIFKKITLPSKKTSKLWDHDITILFLFSTKATSTIQDIITCLHYYWYLLPQTWNQITDGGILFPDHQNQVIYYIYLTHEISCYQTISQIHKGMKHSTSYWYSLSIPYHHIFCIMISQFVSHYKCTTI